MDDLFEADPAAPQEPNLYHFEPNNDGFVDVTKESAGDGGDEAEEDLYSGMVGHGNTPLSGGGDAEPATGNLLSFGDDAEPEPVQTEEPKESFPPDSTTSSTPVTETKEEERPKPSSPTPPPSVEELTAAEGTAPLINVRGLDIDPRVVELIYWSDPKRSGPVFGGVLLVLMCLRCCSLISVVAYAFLAVLTVTISYRVYRTVLQAIQKIGDGNPYKEIMEMDIALTRGQVDQYVDLALQKINCLTNEMRRLILVVDLVDSIKCAVVMWLLTYIGAWFNGLTLIILAWINIFAVPKLYETYQEPIDKYIGMAKQQINGIKEMIESKVPFLKKKKTE